MAFAYRSAGAWRFCLPSVYAGGAWRTPRAIWSRSGGAWRVIYERLTALVTIVSFGSGNRGVTNPMLFKGTQVTQVSFSLSSSRIEIYIAGTLPADFFTAMTLSSTDGNGTQTYWMKDATVTAAGASTRWYWAAAGGLSDAGNQTTIILAG